MFRFIMRETDDYDKLVKFMTPMGLEFGNDEAMGTQMVKCKCRDSNGTSDIPLLLQQAPATVRPSQDAFPRPPP